MAEQWLERNAAVVAEWEALNPDRRASYPELRLNTDLVDFVRGRAVEVARLNTLTDKDVGWPECP